MSLEAYKSLFRVLVAAGSLTAAVLTPDVPTSVVTTAISSPETQAAQQARERLIREVRILPILL